jgi:hypothetical protein
MRLGERNDSEVKLGGFGQMPLILRGYDYLMQMVGMTDLEMQKMEWQWMIMQVIVAGGTLA